MLKNTKNIFGIEVKKRLLVLGEPQCKLAKEIGVSYQYLSELLSRNSKRVMPVDTKKRILKVLEEWEKERGSFYIRSTRASSTI